MSPLTARRRAPVLLAGADANRRAVLRAEFGAALPWRARFSEADDVSEVLERAPSSRMVILAGRLDDADTGATMRLLGARHPRLPVICVEESASVAAGGRC
jgi:DNA-binding NtrC family response regulator